MKLYIIRHGETKANEEGRLQGATDWPLNENGLKLAEITGKALKGLHIDACYSSPLIRASQTAFAFLRESGNGAVPVIYDDRLKEINAGDWELKRMDEMDPRDLVRYFKAPLLIEAIPGGETPRDVCARTQEFLRELTDKNDDKTYLVSTHGCALRCMLNKLYEDPSDFWQGRVPLNCSISLVEAKEGKVELIEKDRIYYDPAMCPDHYKPAISGQEAK